MLIASLLTNLFGAILFLFIFWKQLKEDFASDVIFKLGFSILAGIGVAVAISLSFLPNYLFWVIFLVSVVVLIIGTIQFKGNIYDVFEAFVVAGVPYLALILLFDSAIRSSFNSFIGFIAMLILIFVSYYLDYRYKGFTWYKSGKIGFVGLSTMALFFLIRFVLAILKIGMLSFTGTFEYVLSVIGLLICLSLLLNLGKIKE